MKKVRVRETLLISNDLSELSFNISTAKEYFMGILNEDMLPEDDYDQYFTIEVVIHEDIAGWALEGVRWESDEEFEQRKIITQDKDISA